MSWLSEIATRRMTMENILVLRGKIGRGDGEQTIADMERMARVIRELAERMKKAKAICNDTPEESEPLTLDDAITDILGVLSDNLSPDAKEVLDELAE